MTTSNNLCVNVFCSHAFTKSFGRSFKVRVIKTFVIFILQKHKTARKQLSKTKGGGLF